MSNKGVPSIMYDELVLIQEQYTYSVNVQLDMENSEKLLHYIPNDTSIKLLKEYFIDMIKDSPGNHSRMIYGSYGTGKSHFLTVLSMLASKHFADDIAYETFINRIKVKDTSLANDINAFERDKHRKPFLVVPIVFDFPDFNRCLYFSLQKALFKHGINIIFKTFYYQASEIISKWMKNPSSFAALEKACRKYKTTPDELLESLNRMDAKSEKKFLKVFSEITFGVEFVYEVANISDAMEQVNKATKNKFSGIVFIFDEFGRYMEDNLRTIKVSQIQQLAEYCDHGEGNNHIILVSHKEISQYTKELGKKMADEWKRVEGRFNPFTMNSEKEQSLFFAGNVLCKDERVWEVFSSRFKKELDLVYFQALEFNGYDVEINADSNPFSDCFPLHPISLFALEKLSKKVAQNERTFFTFLSGKGSGSLYAFLSTTDINEFHIVGIDYIYDYFEPSIKSMQSDSSYEWYRKLQLAINKLPQGIDDSSFEVKILKTIAVIGIIGIANVFPATEKIIKSSIDGDNEAIDAAICNLSNNRIIKFSGITSTYDFYNSSIINIDELVDENLSDTSDSSVIKVLNDEFVDFVVYPYDYNNEYKISRVLAPVFYSSKLSQASLLSKIEKLDCDGVLVMTLACEDDIDTITELSRSLVNGIFFINTNITQLTLAVRRYIALKYLDSVKSKYTSRDPAFEQELLYCLVEQTAIVKKCIDDWKSSGDAVVIEGGEICELSSLYDISIIASELMRKLYPSTLIVNNELVNKNNLSGTMNSAKRVAIDAIIRGINNDAYYGLSDLSPEYIFVRSVLAKNGIYHDASIQTINATLDDSRPQDQIQEVFVEFCNNAKHAPVSFETLIGVLTDSPYGLRKGYLPLLVAYMLIGYKDEMEIMSHDVGQEITAELFDEIVSRPSDYTFSIERLTASQKAFVKKIEKLFASYLDKGACAKNRMKAIYEAAFQHYKSVSKFARTTEMFVSEPTKRYRKLMEKNNTNYSKFVLKDLKSLTGDYESAIELIETIINELNTAIDRLGEKITTIIANAVGANEEGLLPYLQKVYSSEWKEKRKKSFDFYTNAFLDVVAQIDNSTQLDDFIKEITKRVAGLEYSFWGDSQVDSFMITIRSAVDTINNYNVDAERSETETMVTIVNRNSNKSVVFDNSEMGDMAITAKNKMAAVFDKFGLAITHDEKVQIILSLLNDLMEGK